MNRNEFLHLTGAGLGAVALSSACSLLDAPEMRVCALAELEAVAYRIEKFNGRKIFLTLRDGKVVIFSLICRHKRCTVAWEESREQFECPCHEGVYDREGEVVDGPPPAPLHRFKHEIREGDVWVLNEFEV